MINIQRRHLVSGMIFESETEVIQLLSCGTTNIWDCFVIVGNKDEYIRHDYIFTDRSHGFNLVGINPDGENFCINDVVYTGKILVYPTE